MICPKCQTDTLVEKSVKNAEFKLDRCDTCKGLWFDDGEVAKFIKEAPQRIQVPRSARKSKKSSCPKCKEKLFVFNYPGTLIIVDACGSCAGVWLDDKEVNEINRARKELGTPLITCPKCNYKQKKREDCVSCGIIIEKYQKQSTPDAAQRADDEATAHEEQSYADDIPGVKGKLLRFIDRSITSMWGSIQNGTKKR
jgi:Zn-finger nucleic acid-binding protein